MQDIIKELTWRGLIHQTTDDAHLAAWLNERPRTIYAGFDPTADSLHVGHMLPLLMLRRFQQAGHRPIALVGGATGMIGDPSGKSEERNLLTWEALQENVAGIKEQMKRFLVFDVASKNAAVLVNNYDWMGEFQYLDFLRDVGKHFPVNVMLAKDSVKGRLDRESGISYTEFSYMLLQAYDFVHLNQAYGCELQIGGSDQWGNITAGIDLARRMSSVQLFGLTNPLLTKSDGGKMGKTESGTIWLSPDRTTGYDFYQYWINVSDADVGKCLRFLTALSQEEIESLDAARVANPGQRESQLQLAEELTLLIHRNEGLQIAKDMTTFFFHTEISQQTDEKVMAVFKHAPIKEIPRERLAGEGLPLIDALVESGLSKSKGDARRTIQQGGAYVNNRRVADLDAKLKSTDLASETVLVLRSGKKSYALLRFTN